MAKILVVIAVLSLGAVSVYFYAALSKSSSLQQSTTSSSTESTPLNSSPYFVMSTYPSNLLIAPGLSESYATLEIEPLLGIGNISLELNAATESPGLQISLSKSTIAYNPNATTSVSFNFSASTAIEPGNYTATFRAQSGSVNVTQDFTILVVPALVVMNHESFIPNNISVPVNTTVVWMNIDTEIGCCDPGYHTVTFGEPNVTQIQGMSSQVLHRFDTWSFQFTAVGTYRYYCIIHPSMLGMVTVTA